MAILSKRGIINALQNGDLGITPFNEDQLNPNSYDVRIDKWIAYYVLNDSEADSVYTKFEVIDQFATPDRFGHQMALPLGHPRGKFEVEWPLFDLAKSNHAVEHEMPESGFILYPGNLYLALTEECIDCKGVIAEISGKSSLARAGIQVHSTAGYANIGDHFRYVIEITVTYPTMVYPHMRIGQVLFHEIDKYYDPEVDKYDGSYGGNVSMDDPTIRIYSPDQELVATAEAAKRDLAARLEEQAKAAEEGMEKLRQIADEATDEEKESVKSKSMKVVQFPKQDESTDVEDAEPITIEEASDEIGIPEELQGVDVDEESIGCNGDYCPIFPETAENMTIPETPFDAQIEDLVKDIENTIGADYSEEEPAMEEVEINIDELFGGNSGVEVVSTEPTDM